jgi:predicted small lipoprotein YifL
MWNSALKYFASLMLVFACPLLCGCGQKGSLYLPDKQDKKAEAHIDGALLTEN